METIIAIAGKPGLYRLVSRGKANLIVESLDENKKRMPVFSSDRVTSLADIAMYTDAEDIPLWKVLKNVGEKEQSKECSLNYKKASGKELRDGPFVCGVVNGGQGPAGAAGFIGEGKAGEVFGVR